MKEIIMSKITSSTVIPISLAASICGGVIWFTSMYQKVDAHESGLESVTHEIKEIKKTQNEFEKEVIERLTRIETKLSVKQ